MTMPDKIPIKNLPISVVVLFEQLVAMACPPKPRRRRVQLAKRVGQASRLPVFGSKRDACATFLEEWIGVYVSDLSFFFVAIKQEG